MLGVDAHPLPAAALLARYQGTGAYTDCYATTVAAAVSQAEFVAAFYTTPVFKLERAILRLVARPSTDEEARELAAARRDSFAAWELEDRCADQLLLTDFRGRTRSWLMTQPLEQGQSTRLLFGSAVVPVRNHGGEAGLGVAVQALMGFHKLYSVVLLHAAARRLRDRHVRAD